ncbi:MAG: ABC transporter ATP-binding protein [Candidatus Acidiferrum sp.]
MNANRIVIQGEGLGKLYRRGATGQAGLLRDRLANFARSPLSVFKKSSYEAFWALKDVSLEIKEGEVLGLIGRNGAGKTTLLKILSRITRPTTGHAEIRGRVGSLLEVGTGFHPELTGRENTFLSGAILGMGKREIERKFDEIVAFAELEKFIDTQVKHYSSGMYVRLAFAVAAHLEPEILLVDEVLAVGDIKFQKKCLGKMGDVARAGRTVVLVSHQLNQIRRLCQRALWVDGGGIRKNGSSGDVVNCYEAEMSGDNLTDATRLHGGRAEFIRWEIVNGGVGQQNILTAEGEVQFRFTLRVNEPLRGVHHGIALYNQSRDLLWGNSVENFNLPAGLHEFTHNLPSLPLRPGVYGWRVSLYDGGERIDDWECVPQMFVSTLPVTHSSDEWAGLLNIPSEFSSREVQVAAK